MRTGLKPTRKRAPAVLDLMVLNPPHEGEKRSTNGFSSEKFTEVPNGNVQRGREAQCFRESVECFAFTRFVPEHPPEFRPGSQRLRDSRACAAGRERQVRLGLPRRRGALH